jgi:hypothetical protein
LGRRYAWLDEALCTSAEHRLLWHQARRDHLEAIEERGEKVNCQCHATEQVSGRPSKDKPDWDAYWWDASSPDIDYARAVCRVCPVKKQCVENRVKGSSGVYAGYLVTELKAQQERTARLRAIREHNRGLNRHDPNRLVDQTRVVAERRSSRPTS